MFTKARVLLFPDYIGLDGVLGMDLPLFRFLGLRLDQLEEGHWDGNINSLPDKNGQPTLVRLSTRMHCDKADLIRECEVRDFLLFYNHGFGTSAIYTSRGQIKDAEIQRAVVEVFKTAHGIP